MGLVLTHFAVYPLACALHATVRDIENILGIYERDLNLFEKDTYNINLENFIKLLTRANLDPGDIQILRDLYCLNDLRGFQMISLKDLMIDLAFLISSDKLIGLKLCFAIQDRKNKEVLDKRQIEHMFLLINSLCYYCGDKKLPEDQVIDLVNSLYTSSGRLDGQVYYPDYYHLILSHPIVEMYCSLQFQGSWQSKVLDEKTVDRSYLNR